MSESTNVIADAMANAVDVSTVDSAPQAEPAAETQAEDTAPPASAEQTTDAPQEDAHETPSRAAKRIQQLLDREREYRDRIAFLEGQQARQEPQKQAEQSAPRLPDDLARWLGDEPKPDAFPAGEFDPQYLRAIARYEARAEQAQATVTQRAAQARHAEQQRLASFNDAVMQAEKDTPDIREVLGGLGQRLPNWQADLLADAGAAVAYAIGKDAEAEARIRAARTPLAVAREIGRIEARLERAKEAPPPQPSAAPPPPPKAVRGTSASNGFDWATASPAEIQARINKG